MSTLSLHYHPLSSYCQKVLIAIDELGLSVDLRLLNLGDPAERAAFLALWPLGKMPVLQDGGTAVVESSIIIEHLQLRHAAKAHTLIPQDGAAALEVRLWDRLFDLYVMTPMQALTGDLLRPPESRDALGVQRAREALAAAYAMLDARLGERPWAAGTAFSMADCAAAPALFYATCYVPIGPQQARLVAYLERLLARPAVARTLEAARPFFQYFPGRAGLPLRYFDPQSEAGAAPSRA